MKRNEMRFSDFIYSIDVSAVLKKQDVKVQIKLKIYEHL